MPTARELLQQADALMRRNRAHEVDTEIPELTEAIAMVAPASAAPSPVPLVLDDIPELTDSVEEIEIASIVELPEDDVEPSRWPRSARGDSDAHAFRTDTAAPPMTLHAVEPIGGRVLPLFAIAAMPVEVHSTLPVPSVPLAVTPAAVPTASTLELAVAKATVIELPVQGSNSAADDAVAVVERIEGEAPIAAQAADEAVAEVERIELEAPAAVPADDGALVTTEEADQPARDATPVDDLAAADLQPATAMPAVEVDSPVPPQAPAADDWARWEALAEEIRMQVLQRIDIFTDTGLRDQLSVQMQPIVERASAELVATINGQVGKLLRAYIAEAIEREIEKWRTGNS